VFLGKSSGWLHFMGHVGVDQVGLMMGVGQVEGSKEAWGGGVVGWSSGVGRIGLG
jgi:hypothetical protein